MRCGRRQSGHWVRLGKPGGGVLSPPLDSRAPRGALEVVPDHDDRGVQVAVRGGDQCGVICLGHGPAGARPQPVVLHPVEEPARLPAFMQASPATEIRPDPRPETRTTGVCPRRPRSWPSAAGVPARTRPRSRSTPRSPPLASHLRPRLAAPGRDRVLVSLRGPVHRNLGSEAHPVQQVRQPRSVYSTPDSRVTSTATRASVHRWSCSQPQAAGPASSAALSLANWSSSSLQAFPPGLLEAMAATPPPARPAATGTPPSCSPAATGRSAGRPCLARTSPRPQAVPVPGGTSPVRSARHHRDTS